MTLPSDAFRHVAARPHQPLRTFHPRRAPLSAGREDALAHLFPRFGFSVHDAAAPVPLTPDGSLDTGTLFGRSAPVVLEIGSGMGESTVAMGVARPEINLLAVEVYKPGVAQTLHHLNRAGATNVRVLRGDGVQVLTDLISPGSLAEIWLFFPDPWPKTKHFKRRLVTTEFAALVASRLHKGGVFRLATDWAPYAESMLAACTATKGLRNANAGWAPRPDFRPRTRFERRGLAAGHEIFDLEFIRR